jgi:cytochrome c oxidase subunit 2
MNRSRRLLGLGVLASAGQAMLSRFGIAQDSSPENTRARPIQVTAKKFQFTPNPIRIKKGEPVVLEITAIDFTHGFNIPDLGMRSDLVPGKITRIPLTLNKTGTYDFLCDNFCGNGHEEMNGKIIVVE